RGSLLRGGRVRPKHGADVDRAGLRQRRVQLYDAVRWPAVPAADHSHGRRPADGAGPGGLPPLLVRATVHSRRATASYGQVRAGLGRGDRWTADLLRPVPGPTLVRARLLRRVFGLQEATVGRGRVHRLPAALRQPRRGGQGGDPVPAGEAAPVGIGDGSAPDRGFRLLRRGHRLESGHASEPAARRSGGAGRARNHDQRGGGSPRELLRLPGGGDQLPAGLCARRWMEVGIQLPSRVLTTPDPMQEPPLSAEREARRRSILQAAIECFAEQGFASARTKDIAARAGVAEGTIYLYFDSKDELLLTAFRETVREFSASVERLLNDPRPFLERLTDFIASQFVRIEQNPSLAAVLLFESRQSTKFYGGSVREVLRTYADAVERLLHTGIERGELRQDLNL